MKKFIAVWIFYIIFAIFLFFGIEFQNNILLVIKQLFVKRNVTRHWIILIALHIILKTTALFIVFNDVIPMYYDLPLIRNQEYREISGLVKRVERGPMGMWFMDQTVFIENESVRFVLL